MAVTAEKKLREHKAAWTGKENQALGWPGGQLYPLLT